jgi:hypothetical protein
MAFARETWEARQREYRRLEDIDDAMHRAKYPALYYEHAEDQSKPEASCLRTFYRRARR